MMAHYSSINHSSIKQMKGCAVIIFKCNFTSIYQGYDCGKRCVESVMK